MAVVRPPLPSDGFTPVPREWLRDARLGLDAKGMLAYILSHAAGYRLTMEQIIAESACSRTVVRRVLGDLEKAGYLVRTRGQRDPKTGHLGAYDYELQAGLSISAGRDQGTEATPGEPSPGAEQAKEPVSAGHDQGTSTTGGERPNKKTMEEDKRRPTHTRGTRLPEDFQPDEHMRKWYRSERIGEWIDGRVEHEKFVNYWVAKPGAAGVKLDWPRTWMNWMREAAQRAQGGGRRSSAPRGAVARPAFRTANEKRDAKNRREQLKSQVFDKIVQMEHIDLAKPGAVTAVSQRAEQIILAMIDPSGMTTCQPSEYTGPDSTIVEAVWYEGPPQRALEVA